MLSEFQNRGPEQRRTAGTQLFYVENSFKALKGRWQALVDPALLQRKRDEEAKLRAWVEADPERRKKYGGAWDAIAETQRENRRLIDEHARNEGNRLGAKGVRSQPFHYPRLLDRRDAARPEPA